VTKLTPEEKETSYGLSRRLERERPFKGCASQVIIHYFTLFPLLKLILERNRKKKLPSTALAMIEELQQTMGVRVFMITGLPWTKKGRIDEDLVCFFFTGPFCKYLSKVYRHEADPKHGKKFTTAHPNWKVGRTSCLASI